jgi:two-component system, NtrC family, sensor histidine kinase HydH
MDIRTQSALLASIVGLALGVSMLLRAGRPRDATLYSLLALTVGGYYLTQFLHSVVHVGPDWVPRVLLGAWLILGASVPAAVLAFFLAFLRVHPRATRYGQQVAVLSVVFGLAVGLTPLAEVIWARVALWTWVLGSLSISVSLLFRRMHQSESRVERLRHGYLAAGAAAAIMFSALDFVPSLGVPFPTLGPVSVTLYLFFLAQTLLRLRLMDLQELFGKVASHTALATVLAAVFMTLTAWVEGNTPLFLFNTVVAAIVILILLEPLRAKIEERVVAIFFRERFELLQSLAALKARMANVIEIKELTKLVLDAFIETRRVTHASIYLLSEDRPGYRTIDHRGPEPIHFIDTAAARGLLNAAASGQKALLLENVERRIAELRAHLTEGKRVRDEIKRMNDIRHALGQMKAGISVPLLGNDRVIGFLNLWDERVQESYASDEIAVILEIAEHVSTVVENSKLYDRMRERDRLAALGEMAAGLAHEIRNPLGAIKGAAQCLDPTKLPGEDGEFLEVIVEEVNRLNGVVSEFLDYARPLKQNFGPTDINEVVTRTIKLIQNGIPEDIELKVELGEGLAKVDADAEQLKQVLINLVQNAVHAMPEPAGRIQVKTSRPDRFSDFRGQGDAIEVQVTDNGRGIPFDQQPHIFVPFYTTKQKGTGLGLAICQRIVKNHGGTIAVQSRPDEGATFSIRLPALNASTVDAPLPVAVIVEPPTAQATTPAVEPKAEGRLSRSERKKRRAAST